VYYRFEKLTLSTANNDRCEAPPPMAWLLDAYSTVLATSGATRSDASQLSCRPAAGAHPLERPREPVPIAEKDAERTA